MKTALVQTILACIMVAVLCVLSAMQVFGQCCDGMPKTPTEWTCVVLTCVLFLLVFAFLCKRTVHTMSQDTFSDYQWAYDQQNGQWGGNSASVHDEHSSRITGPNPDDKELNTWQYNPQNTLVNYSFYNVPANGNPPTQLAPIVDGSIGKRNQPPAQLHGNALCNENPAQQTYAVQSPASTEVVPTSTVQWN